MWYPLDKFCSVSKISKIFPANLAWEYYNHYTPYRIWITAVIIDISRFQERIPSADSPQQLLKGRQSLPLNYSGYESENEYLRYCATKNCFSMIKMNVNNWDKFERYRAIRLILHYARFTKLRYILYAMFRKNCNFTKLANFTKKVINHFVKKIMVIFRRCRNIVIYDVVLSLVSIRYSSNELYMKCACFTKPYRSLRIWSEISLEWMASSSSTVVMSGGSSGWDDVEFRPSTNRARLWSI